MACLALLTALSVASVFVVPVILSILLALVFSGPCRWLKRRRIPEPLSAAAIVLSLLSAVGFFAAALAIPAAGWIEDAPRMAQEVEWKLRNLSGVAAAVVEAEEQITEAAAAAADQTNAPLEVVVEQRGPLTEVALGAPLIVAQTVFVLILTFFILASGSLFYERLVAVMPNFADKRRAISIAYDVEREVSRYLLHITLINAGLGVAVGLALGALGMPNPMAFGLLAFAMNFVPFVGAMVGVVLSFAVALMNLPSLFDAAVVAGVYFLLTSIEGQVVTPWLVGRKLRLNTVVILIAVAFWAWLWSIMGMIMAVPLLVTMSVLCKHIDALRPLGEFLSGPGEARS
nr:AI-2E family transporter [Tateyamaria sp. ANG-S1]